jgi:tetratricopeptide (TPR) repeat protein
VGEARNDLATKRSNRAALMRGGVTGLLAMLVHAFTEFNLHIPAVAILTVTLMALVSGYFRYGTNAHWHLARWPLRMVLAFGLLLGIVYLGTQTWQGAVETHWLQRAKRLKRDPLQAIAALKHAFAADPKNFQTAFDLGEAYRLQSWKADEGWEDAAREAMRWFQRSIALNPVHAYSQVRYGMCLDWLGQRQDAGPYFERALKLDPHGYYTVAHVGWHYAQLREWAKAKEFFERSLSLNQPDNRIARSYLDIVNRRLAEQSAAP